MHCHFLNRLCQHPGILCLPSPKFLLWYLERSSCRHIRCCQRLCSLDCSSSFLKRILLSRRNFCWRIGMCLIRSFLSHNHPARNWMQSDSICFLLGHFGQRSQCLGSLFCHRNRYPKSQRILFLLMFLLSHKHHKHCHIGCHRIGKLLHLHHYPFLQPAIGRLSCMTGMTSLSIWFGQERRGLGLCIGIAKSIGHCFRNTFVLFRNFRSLSQYLTKCLECRHLVKHRHQEIR